MKYFRLKLLYTAAVLLLFLIITLLTYVGFSTYHTLDSNQDNAIQAVKNQGKIIIDILSAALQTIVREKGYTAGTGVPPAEINALLTRLTQQIGNTDQIHHLCFINADGVVNVHSNGSIKTGHQYCHQELTNNHNPVSRHHKLSNGNTVFEVVKKIATADNVPVLTGGYIVVGMTMTEFDAARRADIHHALIMVGILVLLGGGAFFFIYVIRKYYTANLKLMASRDYIHLLVENMANGLISINMAGDIRSCNTLATTLLGLNTRPDSPVRHISDIFDSHKTGLTATITAGIPVRDKKIDYQRHDGTTMSLLINANPFTETSNKQQGAVIIIHDLSEIKALEDKVKRSEKYAAIGKLAAVVAHEIRNPLSSIRGFANYFTKILADDTKNTEYAQIVIDEVDRIDRVITDLLQYSKSETLHLQKTNFHYLVEQTLLLTDHGTPNQKTKIVNTISDTLPEVTIDPDKIRQVILNLVLNAIQVTDGDVSITISAQINEKDDLTVWVEDNGPGIDVEDKSVIFDPFFSLREQGSGLGLSIVQKIIENHDGTITFESPLNERQHGTRFIITLPVNSDGVS